MSRGVERRDIFMQERDRRTFLTYLLDARDKHDVGLFADCLMGNHFHFLLTVNEVPLSTFMRDFQSRYAAYFNSSYDRVGHLFQGRYTALECRDPASLVRLIAYIHLNPVRAGFTRTPGEWPWSSHQEFLEGRGPFLDLERMERVTGLSPEQARTEYLERLEALSHEPLLDPTLAQMIEVTSERAGIEVPELLSGRRGGAYTRARLRLARWARQEGFTDVELAEALRCSPSALTRLHQRNGRSGA